MDKTSEIRRFHAILSKVGMEQKQVVLAAYKVSSTKDLTLAQLRQINSTLENQLSGNERLLKRRQSTVLTLATKAGIKDANDFDKFNSFMLKSSVYHKELRKYNVKELNDLIKQFRAILANNKKAALNKVPGKTREILAKNNWKILKGGMVLQ